jgi:hypothetical protein
MVDALLAAGGDLHMADDEGKTAADHARAGGHTDLANRLVES